MDEWRYSCKGKDCIRIKVIPGAAKNQLKEIRNGELIVHLNAQPEKGKANKELIKYLSKLAKVSKSEIILKSGETSRHKILELPCGAAEKLEESLG